MREKQAIPSHIPLRDFFRNPEKTAYKISPDGKFISHTEPYERRMNIFVEPRASVGVPGAAVRITSETERDITMNGYWWKNNDRIVYVKDFGGDENFHLFGIDRDGSNFRDLTPFEGVKVEVVDHLEEIPNEVLIGMNQRDPQVFDVYRLNVVTGELQLVAENPGNVTRWLTDHTGAVRVAVATDGVNNTLLYRASEQEAFREVLTTHFKDALDPFFFTFDNVHVYAGSNLGRDRTAIVKFDIAQGKELDVLFEHPEVDVDGIAFSKKRKVLTMIAYTTWKQQRHFLDDETRKLFDRLVEKLPNYEIGISDYTKDEQTFIVRTHSDRSLGAFYLYDFVNDRLEKLAEVSPWLKEEDLAPTKPIVYQSRDGLTIHGYLTLPIGKEPKHLPVVVHPHGGPWVRDRWTYDPEVQFLANRGYAVLQVNYRGSTGYGRKFWEASFKQWGRKMQDDVTDGVQWLIKEDVADPNRVAIYGGSYGGYCTLAGLTFTPETYACGVDYVGVSNLLTFIETIPPYWKPYLESMYEMVGNPVTERAMLEAASPVFHVDKIKAPLMVVQGAKDPRVNINESDQIVEALRQRGIDVPYIVEAEEGHGFRNEENRFKVYEAMEGFLAKHLNGH
ncbi:MAG TPA: S9 family peptidase [Candidatus Kapabacteria bacterium]|jgi:dipeptidyl aminopeptidase/acylaminoacyl peptidase|nr:S9 family peptidase [Candidatus Kapabacteria bacterium]